MANIEKFLFQVDANTKQASDSLNGIIRLMNTIEKLNGKGVDNFYTTNQKDMDKAMRSMADLVEGYEDFNGVIEELIANQEKLAKTPMPKMPVTPRKLKEGATEEQRKEYETRKKNSDQAKKKWAEERKQAVEARRTAERNISLLRQQQQIVKKGYKDTQLNYRHLASMEMNASKNFKPHFKLANARYNFSQDPAEAKKQLENTLKETQQPIPEQMVKQQIKDVNNLLRRGKTLSRRAQAAGYMSTMEAASFYKDVRTAKGFRDATNGDIAENKRYMVSRGQQRSILAEQVDTLKATEGNDQNLRDIRVEKEEEIRLIEKELEARAELDRVLEDTADKMARYFSQVVGDGKTTTEVKPERGTMKGMMYERAPAIGLALTNAAYDNMTAMFRRGVSPAKTMRPDEVMIGQMTNTPGDRWRGDIRGVAMQEGITDKLGFTGQEMLGMESNYLTNHGYKGMKDLNAAMTNQAQFARVNGISAEETSSFFQPLYQSGAVNGAQTKQIKDAFVGAIHSSGMAGREKDQLAALDAIVSSVSAGKNLSNTQLMNVMGIQSLFAQAGDRSVQGADGGQFLANLNQGIKKGVDNPMLRLVYGQGTKYRGLAGRWDLTKQMEKGISDPENLKVIGNLATQYGKTLYGQDDEKAQNASAYAFIRDSLGVDVSTNQVEALMKLYRSGSFDQKSIDKALKEDKATGGKLSDKKAASYKDSQASRDNQYEAITAKLSTQLNELISKLKNLTNAIGKIDNMIGQTSGAFSYVIPALYGVGSAALMLAAFYGRAVALPFAVGQLVRGRNAGSMTSSGPPRSGGGFPGGRFNPLNWWRGRRGGGGGSAAALDYDPRMMGPQNFPPGENPYVNNETTAARQGSGFRPFGFINSARNGIRNMIPMNEGARSVLNGTAGETSGLARGLGTMSKVLGKIFFPLALLSGGASIADAPSDKKMEATGSVVGGLAGAWAGAEAGAAGGAAIGGGIGALFGGVGAVPGAAIGGFIGGIGGAIGGGFLGGKTGGALGSTFDPKKAEAAMIDPNQQSQISGQGAVTGEGQQLAQTDKQTTDRKYQTEVRRASNIGYEKENINRYVTILDRVTQLLTTARAQNGIIGNSNGLGGQNTLAGVGGNPITVGNGNVSGGVGSVGASNNAGKLWNYFKSQGLSDGATAGILGNLEQESNLDPNKPGGGLAQWQGSRWTALQKFSKDKGLDPNSLDAQMQFLMKELNSGSYGSVAKMNGMTPAQAALYFSNNFEKPGIPMNDKRQGYANGFYGQYHGSAAQNTYNGAGSTLLSAQPAINSVITVNVKPDQSVSAQVNNSKEMQNTAKYIQNAVYGGLNYYAKEMTRV